MNREQTIAEAAARLSQAAASRRPTPPVRDLIGLDLNLAYAVQQELTAERVRSGARIVGRKIGLTSPAVQEQMNVAQPDFGVLFHDMQVANGGTADSGGLIAPRAEVEIAFVLRADLAHPLDKIDTELAADAVEYAVAAIEIVDSRVAGWDIAITDTVADNASSGLFVLGDVKAPLGTFRPPDTTMTLERDGELVSTGTGRECLGDPLFALTWLARTVAARGAPLRAGEIVLSGSLGPLVPVTGTCRLLAQLSDLGQVSVTLSEQEHARV